jgi:hypothetical protein
MLVPTYFTGETTYKNLLLFLPEWEPDNDEAYLEFLNDKKPNKDTTGECIDVR